MLEFAYEPDERPKRKHYWDRPVPGFIREGNTWVGKCPRSIDNAAAGASLRDGEPYSPAGWKEPWPKRIYAVIDGIPYRATPTVPGRSYHGFPEHPRELKRLRSELIDRLRERARAQGRLREFESWLNRRHRQA
jgi:hypothetical protein